MMRLTTLTTVLATLIAAFALAASATAGEKPHSLHTGESSSQAPDELLTLRQDSDTEEAEEQQEGEGKDAEGEEEEEQTGTSLQRGNRMEFDARLVRGERAGSGAVFLFQRVPRPLPSMVDKRSSFLGNSVDEILGARWKKKFDSSKQESTAN